MGSQASLLGEQSVLSHVFGPTGSRSLQCPRFPVQTAGARAWGTAGSCISHSPAHSSELPSCLTDLPLSATKCRVPSVGICGLLSDWQAVPAPTSLYRVSHFCSRCLLGLSAVWLGEGAGCGFVTCQALGTFCICSRGSLCVASPCCLFCRMTFSVETSRV